MIYTAKVPETDPGITMACAQFADQITPVLPMDGMAIVLLEPDGNTSRVVYSWAKAATSWRSLTGSAGEAPTLPQQLRPSLRISLDGQKGLLGEVLVRGCGLGVYGSSRREVVRQCADHLALALENIGLHRRLNSNQQVSSAVQRIAQAAAPGAPVSRVFRRFATEIRTMVEFQRLSVYLVSQESNLAICAYRTGQGVGRRRSRESAKLSSSGLGETAASGESRIFPDLSECEIPPVWNQVAASGMRSALLVPVAHRGVTVGMVLLEHRLPRAFGTVDQACVEDVVAALSPSMAGLASPNQPIANPRRPAQADVQLALAKVFSASQLLEEIFPPFVATLAKVVRIDRASISWTDPNGHDLNYLWASPCQGNLEPELIPETSLSIDTRLYFKGQTIGVLTIFRDGSKRFSFQEQTILDQVGIQISPVVQTGRLYVHARRQAFQLQRLSRVDMSPMEALSLTSLTRVLVGQMSDIGQADWSAVFTYDHQPLGQSPMAEAIIHQKEMPEGLIEEIADLAAKCLGEGAPVLRSLARGPESAAIVPYPAKGHPAEFSREESWKCLALPLMNSAEKSGVLVLGRSEGLPWTKEEIYLLEAFVGEAANEIESARREDAAQRTKSGRVDGRLKPLQHELLADIAHSLRSPITSIKGVSIDMLQRDIGWTHEMTQEFLQIIVRESDRLDRVVSDLLSTT